MAGIVMHATLQAYISSLTAPILIKFSPNVTIVTKGRFQFSESDGVGGAPPRNLFFQISFILQDTIEKSTYGDRKNFTGVGTHSLGNTLNFFPVINVF